MVNVFEKKCDREMRLFFRFSIHFAEVLQTSADEKFPETQTPLTEGLKLVPPGQDSNNRPSRLRARTHASGRLFRFCFRAEIFQCLSL